MPRRLNDWLESYIQYCSGHEAPTIFHQWTGLSILSGAVRRNVWVDRGYYTLYPNLYVILVATSGRLRKSAATGIGQNLLKDVPDIQVIHERVTMEALVECLDRRIDGAPDGTAFIYAPEFTVLLGGDDPNSKRLIAFLVSVYEGKDTWEYTTITRGRRKLSNVLLTILGATTPEWMANIPRDAIGGGLIPGRVILVPGKDRQKNVAWPFISQDMKQMREELRRDLVDISLKRGELEVTPAARKLFSDWYDTIREPDDVRIANFVERIHDHVLKVAVLLSLARGDSLALQVKEMQEAITMLQEIEKQMPGILTHFGTSEHAQDMERVLNQLRQAGGSISHSALLSKNSWKLSAEEFRKILQTLAERRMVEPSMEGRGIKYTLIEKQPRSSSGSKKV